MFEAVQSTNLECMDVNLLLSIDLQRLQRDVDADILQRIVNCVLYKEFPGVQLIAHQKHIVGLFQVIIWYLIHLQNQLHEDNVSKSNTLEEYLALIEGLKEENDRLQSECCCTPEGKHLV